MSVHDFFLGERLTAMVFLDNRDPIDTTGEGYDVTTDGGATSRRADSPARKPFTHSEDVGYSGVNGVVLNGLVTGDDGSSWNYIYGRSLHLSQFTTAKCYPPKFTPNPTSR